MNQTRSSTCWTNSARGAGADPARRVKAHHQIFGYLIKSFGPVGRFGLPPDQRFRFVWRVPEPPAD
ncbi:hypothetical protein ACWCPF_17080 [Streptomyces sp. NPDC001858]